MRERELKKTANVGQEMGWKRNNFFPYSPIMLFDSKL